MVQGYESPGYTHSLFVFNAYINTPDDEVMRWVRKPSAKYATYDDTLVLCHSSEKCGEEILDENVFPELDVAATEESAYELHRDRCIKKVSECKKGENLHRYKLLALNGWLMRRFILMTGRFSS